MPHHPIDGVDIEGLIDENQDSLRHAGVIADDDVGTIIAPCHVVPSANTTSWITHRHGPMDHRLSEILRYTRIHATCLIALICSPTFAAEPLLYANTCVEQESGDVAGYVVIVQDGAAQPSISLSWSEGSLKGPAAATVTDYDRPSGRLAFSVHVDSGDFHFIGKMKADRLEGTISSPWESGPERLRLEVRPRKIAYEPSVKCR